VALGCVIRGETSHYDIVANESARALLEMGTAHGIPVGNGILTVDNRDQAWVRANVEGKNKGGDAACACADLMNLAAEFARKRQR
jgi:6,7-dimethyl-8-ribityllumazine synthase